MTTQQSTQMINYIKRTSPDKYQAYLFWVQVGAAIFVEVVRRAYHHPHHLEMAEGDSFDDGYSMDENYEMKLNPSVQCPCPSPFHS